MEFSLQDLFAEWSGPLLSDGFLTIWCAIILAWGTGWFAKFLYERSAVCRALARVSDGLGAFGDSGGFRSRFSEYSDAVLAEPVLRHGWRQLRATLVFPNEGEAGAIQRTGEVEEHLGDDTVIGGAISLRFYNSVPGELTGLGILSTFLGLAAGVARGASGLATGDSVAVTTALEKLLSGASLAFITSIVGLLLSLLFLFGERFLLDRLYRRRRKWTERLEELIPLWTLEGVAIQQLHQQREATGQLKKFNTELIVALEGALEEKVANKLSPLLQQLVDSTEKLRAERTTESTTAIERMMVEFTAKLNERTASEFDQVKSTLETAATALREASSVVSRDLSEAGRAAASELVAPLGALRQGMERFESTSQTMAQTLETAVSRVSGALDASAAGAAEQLTQAGHKASSEIGLAAESFRQGVSGLEIAVKALGEVVGQARQTVPEFVDIGRTIDEAHGRMRDSLAAATGLANSVRGSSQEFAAAWKEAKESVEAIRTVVGAMGEQHRRMEAAWRDYESRFETVDASLARAFKQVNEGFSGYAAKTTEFAQSLDNHAGNAIKTLSSAVKDLEGAIEELSDTMARRPGTETDGSKATATRGR